MKRTKETGQQDSGLYIGIDPGQTGAIAAIDSRMEIEMLEDWPGDEIGAAKLVWELECNQARVALEHVHAMPKQGVTSMFKFGTNYGIWKGILAAVGIPFVSVRPQQWQKGVVQKKQDSKPSVAAAARLFASSTSPIRAPELKRLWSRRIARR